MKTLIVNAHVISPGLDLRGASIAIVNGKIKAVVAGKVDRKGYDTVVDVRGPRPSRRSPRPSSPKAAPRSCRPRSPSRTRR